MDDAKRALSFGVPEAKPKYPQYAVPAKRVESFNSWPEYLPVRPDKMIEAGLAYTGVGDSVRCFQCGGGLRSWESGDDPWLEHAKWYPWCQHVLLVKGQGYVDKVGRGENPNEASGQDEELKRAEVRQASAVAMESCIQMGYPESMVTAAAEVYKKRHGNDNYRGEDLCEIIFKMEETEGFQPYVEETADNGKQPSTVTDATANAARHTGGNDVTKYTDGNDVTKHADGNDVTKHAGDADREPAAATGITNGFVEKNYDVEAETATNSDLDQLQEENQRLKENHLCKICMDATADIIFLPCGHMVSCPQCAPAMSKCPVCRVTIQSRLKAYWA